MKSPKERFFEEPMYYRLINELEDQLKEKTKILKIFIMESDKGSLL
jgi:hypothetical protein